MLRLNLVFNANPNDTNLEDIEVAKRSRDFVRHCEPQPESKGKLRKWFPW